MLSRYHSLFLCFQLLVCIVEGSILLKSNNPACQKLGPNALLCDFQDSTEDIELGNIEPKLVNFKFITLTIHNANSVTVSKNVCYDLVFKQVGSIRFLSDLGCSKKANSVTITESEADRVPRSLSKLTLVNSNVDTINCDLGLNRLIVSKSVIKSLNVPLPAASNSYMTIEHTLIEKIIKLNVQQKTTLSMTNATISKVEKEGISVGDGGTLVMSDCKLSKTHIPILALKPGSKFTLKNLDGHLPIISKDPDMGDVDGKRPPGVPIPKEAVPIDDEEPELLFQEECICPSQAWWIIPTFIALCEAFLIVYTFGIEKKPSLFKMATTKDSETGYDNFNINVQGSPPGYDSYYTSGPQYPNDPMVRRR